MKKHVIVLIGLLFLCAGWIAWNVYTVYTQYNENPLPTASPAPPVTETTGSGNTYRMFRVPTGTPLSLIANFTTRSDAKSLMKEYGCTSAVSGGFYTETNTPLGLFKTNNTQYAPKIQSSFVNGFLWFDEADVPHITRTIDESIASQALQTGPILIEQRKPVPLTIRNDFGARRVVAALDTSGDLIFLVLYDADKVFDGPLLADVPKTLSNIFESENIEVTDAINLDGGSASAFFSTSDSLSELTPVGSLFCLNI